MDSLENPFRPGAGTPPPTLTGRDDLIDRFGVTLRRAVAGRPGKSLISIGLRGVGKTVLLNRFAEIAGQEGLHEVFIEAKETSDFPQLLAVRLRTLLLRLDRTKPTRLVRRALGVLKAFCVRFGDGSTLSFDVDALLGEADSGVLETDVTDLLVAVGTATKDHGTGLLIAVDEVQYLSATELGALIAAIHRTTQLGLPVVLVGAGLPQVPGLAGEAKSYAERLFDFPSIGELLKDDARAAIREPIEDRGCRIDGDALDLIVSESHGYPYFLQEWGARVWNGAPDRHIVADDVRNARQDVLRQLDDNFFRVRLDRLTPKEKEYMRAMAALGPGPHRSGDIAAKLGVKVESVAPRRSVLIKKGMIYSPAHGDTAFTVPLFDEFLLRALPASD